MVLDSAKEIVSLILISFFLSLQNITAQNVISENANLNDVFSTVFQTILGDRNGDDGKLVQVGVGSSNHATHFKDASIKANDVLTPLLNNLISENVSSFPLSATAAGRTWDLSTGQPVSILESLGPIFAETGKTLGKGKINLGLNYSYLDLSKFRGLGTDEMEFVFTHIDAGNPPTPPLGNNPNESDLLSIKLNLNVNASIAAFFATYGVTEKFDIGIAIPVISISMDGGSEGALATINSFTFPRLGEPNHLFGDKENPRFTENVIYNAQNTGLGDITLRLKYSFAKGDGVNFATLVDTRLPTGDPENFRGTGKVNVRVLGIFSKQINDFTPHVNVGYEFRGSDFDSNEIEFAIGFDQKIVSGLTFAFDILGEINHDESQALKFSNEDITIVDHTDLLQMTRIVKENNIPDLNDNVFNLAAGFRVAPSKNLIFLANALVPLNEGGLRSNIIPTAGLAFSF